MGNGSPGGCLGGAALAVGAVLLAPLLAIYGLLAGKKAGGRQPERPRLPYLAISRIHREDRPSLERARKAAERSIDVLYPTGGEGPELGETVAREIAGEVSALVTKIYELGERLSEARDYARQHDVEAIGREQADLEIRLEEAAGEDERASLREAMDALAERARHAATVHREIRTMSARLVAACSTLETLQARLSRTATDPAAPTTGSEELLGEVRERQRDAGRALEAYSAAAREIGRLG